ncbi:hypothetical protein WN943_027821 [Citrus x changshan-huyou]
MAMKLSLFVLFISLISLFALALFQALPPMASIIGAACVAECDATGNEPSSGQTRRVESCEAIANTSATSNNRGCQSVTGQHNTIITGSRSVDGGFTIFNCAIVALTREAFIACGITFRNTATKPVSSRPPIRLRFLDILQCGFEELYDLCETANGSAKECDHSSRQNN